MKKSLLISVIFGSLIIILWCTPKSTEHNQLWTGSTDAWAMVFEDSTWADDTSTQISDNSITKVRLYQLVSDPENYQWVKITIWCEDSMWYFDAETDFKESEKYTKLFDLIKRYDNEANWYYNPWKSQDMVEFYSYELINDDRELNIYLSGTITLWWVCDTPRVIETIKSTYKWFGFDDVHLYLNNTPIETALGGRWE